jgi:hypothetical protein
MDQKQALHRHGIPSIPEVKVNPSNHCTPTLSPIRLMTLGSAHTSSSSDSSSDHEEMPLESLSQLTTSLKLAQSHTTTLSTNFARLMRLLVDDELEAMDRQIAQVRNGSYDTLRTKYKEALAECENKRRIARSRLVAAETEIDIRFQAMVDTEWSQFKVHSPLTGLTIE